mgnify:CR=1 FL=1
MTNYLHQYYQNLGYKKGLCIESEKVYEQIITLPMFPLLKDEEINEICNIIINLLINL